MTLVLDSSVAMKWLLPEAGSAIARRVYGEWQGGRFTLVAPSLILAEVANALWKKVRRHELYRQHAARLFGEFLRLGLPVVPADGLVFHALGFSLRYDHPVHDCIYMALAAREQCALLTADESLSRKFSAHEQKMVRLLSEWPA